MISQILRKRLLSIGKFVMGTKVGEARFAFWLRLGKWAGALPNDYRKFNSRAHDLRSHRRAKPDSHHVFQADSEVGPAV